MNRNEIIGTYQSAIRANQLADSILSALLKAKYGKRAGDMRYRPAETVEIANAMRAKLEASEAQQTAWLATMQLPSVLEANIAHEVSSVEGRR